MGIYTSFSIFNVYTIIICTWSWVGTISHIHRLIRYVRYLSTERYELVKISTLKEGIPEYSFGYDCADNLATSTLLEFQIPHKRFHVISIQTSSALNTLFHIKVLLIWLQIQDIKEWPLQRLNSLQSSKLTDWEQVGF